MLKCLQFRFQISNLFFSLLLFYVDCFYCVTKSSKKKVNSGKSEKKNEKDDMKAENVCCNDEEKKNEKTAVWDDSFCDILLKIMS